MDRRRAAAALLALAACFVCSAAAPTNSDQTALELHDGTTEGCYYNFQHYGEGDRIMTNEPCLNCTCHNRMLMCYLRVCPFTKPIGHDCTVEKRADQCCPIVTCPDVPVDLLTSTSTSSPAEYGSTGVGKYDRYGCSINGKYFSEGSKVPSTPNKPCEHCYCIRNMTTCVMQECTLHVDGCTPIYHKDVCCPVRYSCDHEEEILFLDDMTTTERPTPGFILTTTSLPVTQSTQDCLHDDQIFPDGALIKTAKACEHCYCMKGDIVCVVQECGTPMENEGKNCTSLPPRHGQCCPDTYICEGDDHGTDLTTETIDQSTTPPRRTGAEGSGYRIDTITEAIPFETDTEGSGEEYVTSVAIGAVEGGVTEKVSSDIVDEITIATTENLFSQTTEPDKGQNTIPDSMSDKEITELPKLENIPISTEKNIDYVSTLEQEKTTDPVKNVDGQLIATTESAFRKEDNNMVSDEIITIRDNEKSATTIKDLVDETTLRDSTEEMVTKDENIISGTTIAGDIVDESLVHNTETEILATTQATDLKLSVSTQAIDTESGDDKNQKTTENIISFSTTERIILDDVPITSSAYLDSSKTTIIDDKIDLTDITTTNPVTKQLEDNVLYPGRIPGEGDCLLNGITYSNNTVVPSTNNCHTRCKCLSSIINCDPIICSPPPEYMEHMNDCQPIYDSPDACCPTYVCSGKETIPPQSHNQMSGTESPKPIAADECNSKECSLNNEDQLSSCKSEECLHKLNKEQEQTQIPLEADKCQGDKCPISPVVACEGDNCESKPIDLEPHNKPNLELPSSSTCDGISNCENPQDVGQVECNDDKCRRKDSSESDMSNTEVPTHTLTNIGESTTEITTFGVTKNEDLSQSEITTVPQITTDQNISKEKTELPEMLTTQKIPKKSDDSYDMNYNTEKTEIESVSVTEGIKLTEETETESVSVTEGIKLTEETGSELEGLHTNGPELHGDQEIYSKTTQTEQAPTTKESPYREPTKSPEKVTDNSIVDEYEGVTEKDQIYTESVPKTTDFEKMDTELLHKTPGPSSYDDSLKPTHETVTVKDIPESHKTENPTTLSVLIDKEFDQSPETYEIPTTTNSPLEYSESDDKFAKPIVISESIEPVTDTTRFDTTDTELHEIENEKDITESFELNTERGLVTKQFESIPTRVNVVGKDVIPETTQNYDGYTDSPDNLSTKAEEVHDTGKITTERPLEYEEFTTLSSKIFDNGITDTEISSTESSEQKLTTIETETDKNTADLGQEIITPTVTATTSDEPVTEIATDKQYDHTAANKDSNEIFESTSTEKQRISEDSLHLTTINELETNHDIKQDSSSAQPEFHTTTGYDFIATEKDSDQQNIITEDTGVFLSTVKVLDSDIVTYEHPTEKINAITNDASTLETTTEKRDVIQTTSNKPTTANEQEIDKFMTTISPSKQYQETTTVPQDIVAIIDSQTTPSFNVDDEIQHLITEMPIKSATEKETNLTEKEKTSTTFSMQSSDQSDDLTETVTESQKKDIIEDITSSHIDSTTKTAVVENINEDKTTTVKTPPEQETIFSDIITDNPQHIDKASPTFEEVLSSTTVGLETTKEKVTNILLYTTENAITVDKDTKVHTDVTNQEEVYKTTERFILEEELSTHENKPNEAITQKNILQEEPDIVTENIEMPNVFETGIPVDVITTESSLSVFGTTDNDIFSDSHKTSKESETISSHGQSDESILTTSESNVEDKTRIQTENPFIPSEEQDIITKSPITLSTDSIPITIRDSSQTKGDVSDPESTTKYSYDQTIKTEKEHTTVSDQYTKNTEKEYIPISDQYTTQSLLQDTKTSENEYTEKDKSFVTTESSIYVTSSYADVTTLSAFDEKATVQQEISNDKQMNQSDEVIDSKTTLSSNNMQDIGSTTTVPFEKEGLGIENQETVTEKVNSYLSEDQTTMATDEMKTDLPSYLSEDQTTMATDEMKTDLPSEKITTALPMNKLDSDIHSIEVTKSTPTREFELTTIHSELPHYQTISDATDDKNVTVNYDETQTHTVATDIMKPSVTEMNDVDKETYFLTETDKTENYPIELATEPGVHKVTKMSETTYTESIKQSSDKQDFEKTDFTKEVMETTDSNYVTQTERKESSTPITIQATTTFEDNKLSKFDKTTPSSISDFPETTTQVIEKETLSNIDDVTTVASHEITFDKMDEIKPALHTQSTLETQTTKPITETNEIHPDDDNSIISMTEATNNLTADTKDVTHLPQYSTQSSLETDTAEVFTEKKEITEADISDMSVTNEKEPDSDEQHLTTSPAYKYSETTPFAVELTEHTYNLSDEATTKSPLDEIETALPESQAPERGDLPPEDLSTNKHEYYTTEKLETTIFTQNDDSIQSTVTSHEPEAEISITTEKSIMPTSVYDKINDIEKISSTVRDSQINKEYTTESINIQQTSSASTLSGDETSTKKDIIDNEKPEISDEKTISEAAKSTTPKIPEESSSYLPPHTDKVTKPEEKPFDSSLLSSTITPDSHKPEFTDEPSEDISSPDLPPSGGGGYGQETDYIDEDQAFGPGTCRYGGKVYVSAQQIPRDDPCDFCFCFRSDIICLQQSCPPPIHGCHEEPIQGFCCPRYECPVSMATTLNVTTTTTTTTTTLPPHFLPHAYKGAAHKKGCQIKGHTYKVGEVVRASSGPCLHCTCGGDGQMKCDPKACTPEPMLRQMIAAAVSSKRRR